MKPFLVFVLSLCCALTASPVGGAELDGRIVDAASRDGIPELTVKLIPPMAMQSLRRPEKITTTDRHGEFRFTDTDTGKYLLEVYQGVTLLYRGVVEINQDTHKRIELKRKAR